MSARPVHVPVMLREVLQSLQLSEGLTVVDGTVGAGGHSVEILKRIGSHGRLFGFDRDPMMLQFAAERLESANVSLINDSYVNAQEHLAAAGVPEVDRVLLDLGLSSDQLSDNKRGFGFDAGGPLDMRFDTSDGITAAEFLNTRPADEIEKVLREFGEEPMARQIAAEIENRRRTRPLKTTGDLQECVLKVARKSRPGRNPATQTFQALRIAVNEELRHVSRTLTDILPAILKPGGIAAVITFHSLEDRIVKNAFKGQQQWTALTKKPITASPAEIRLNPRSRSAKLRAAMKKAL